MKVSRLLEERVAHAEGIPHVKKWLQIAGVPLCINACEGIALVMSPMRLILLWQTVRIDD